MVYAPFAVNGCWKELWKRAALRARRIYFCHLGVFTSLLLVVALGILKTERVLGWVPLFRDKPILAFLLGATFTYQPPLLDILPMYCIFLLMMPLVIRLLIMNRSILVLLFSGGTWLCAQFGAGSFVKTIFGNLPINLGHFDISAWQLLFVAGLFFGVRRCTRIGGNRPLRTISIIVSCVLVVVFFLFRHDLIIPNASDSIWPLAESATLGPLRLLNFAALGILLSASCFWPNHSMRVRSFAYLGRHSLAVFTFSILCVYAVMGSFGEWLPNSWLPLIITLLCLAGLYLPAWLCEKQSSSVQDRSSEMNRPFKSRSSRS